MTRDLDLIRAILLKIETADAKKPTVDEWEMPGYELQSIKRHVVILHKGGLIEAGYSPNPDQTYGYVAAWGLTMDGYDLLDNLRNETVFKRTKEKILKTAGSASLEVVIAVAKGYMRELFGLSE